MKLPEKRDTEDCSLIMRPFRYLHEKNMRKRLRQNRFTLISQNCLGGVIYKMLGLQDQSPTINMFIRGESFVKLASDPKKYMQELEPFPITEEFDEPGLLTHPVIGVGDIRLNCLHYSCCKDAIEAWNRRKTRVDYDRCLLIATDWDLNYDEELIKKTLSLPYPKVVFTANKRNDADCIYCDKKIWSKTAKRINMPVLTDFMYGYERCFEKIFDTVEWINSSL